MKRKKKTKAQAGKLGGQSGTGKSKRRPLEFYRVTLPAIRAANREARGK